MRTAPIVRLGVAATFAAAALFGTATASSPSAEAASPCIVRHASKDSHYNYNCSYSRHWHRTTHGYFYANYASPRKWSKITKCYPGYKYWGFDKGRKVNFR